VAKILKSAASKVKTQKGRWNQCSRLEAFALAMSAQDFVPWWLENWACEISAPHRGHGCRLVNWRGWFTCVLRDSLLFSIGDWF